MGGNALTIIGGTRRFLAKEYHELVPEVKALTKLAIGSEEAEVHVIPAYKNKESFGDMDVLIEANQEMMVDIKFKLATSFSAKYMVTNGAGENVLIKPGPASLDQTYSIAYKGLQIDFIFARSWEYWPSYYYYSYNDLGNLLGRVAHRFGMKFGHKGLIYPFKDGDYAFEEIPVEDKWYRILAAFGWPLEDYGYGFDTLEDIFEFVAKSEFFNPEIYLLENRNAKARYRDSKRKTYSAFLAWCEKNKDRLPSYDYSGEKKDRLDLMFERFPGFRQKYIETCARYQDHLQFKAKFNGDMVREITGKGTKELGAFMAYLRNKFADQTELKASIMESSDEVIKTMILHHNKNFDEAAKLAV